MDGGLFIKEKPITLTLIIFTFLCFIFLSTKAKAENFCVGCPTATAANCTVSTNCPAGVNGGGVCPTILAAVTDAVADPTSTAETIKIAQGTYPGPGTGAGSIDPPFGASPKTINIQGGFNITCSSSTVDPTNTIINAPMNDRVFHIDNTTANLLTVTLEGLTITMGDPLPNCGGGDNGGGGYASNQQAVLGVLHLQAI